ncbi:MAG: hypothetical protein Q8N16_04350, partial [bacterium]|nr:hypothetical protein [bacterium]
MSYLNLRFIKPRPRIGDEANESRKTIALSVGVLAMVFFISLIVRAWTEPSLAPPGGNVSAPVNVGNIEQAKSGRLGVGVSDADDNYGLTVGAKGIKITNTGTSPSLFVEDQSGDATPFMIDTNGKVGIGTSSPGAKLEVGGQVKITGGSPGADKVLTSDASGLASWVTPASAVGGSGIDNYIPRWSGTSALENSVIYQTDTGNVGIGTASPGAKLEVGGQVKITGGSPGANKVLTSDATGLASWQAVAGTLPSGTSGQTLRHDGASWIANSVIFNNGTNIGIGTANPTIKLAIGDTDTGLNWAGSGQLDLYSDNTRTLSLRGGNVGIGTIGPTIKLAIGDTDTGLNWAGDGQLD